MKYRGSVVCATVIRLWILIRFYFLTGSICLCGEKWSWDAWLSTWGRDDRKTSSVSTTYVLGLKLLFFCLYVLILWWYGVINYVCSWKIFKLCSLINSNVMTNLVQARTIALFYCNASFEPEKDNTHASIDHDSIIPTLYGIVMVDFTLVTCSSHSIRLVSTTFSNKSTMLTLCLICLLPVCYIHLITCLSDQTLDFFLSPPIESWWNRGAHWAWQLPTENVHVHQPDTIGIIIEGQPVVRGVPNLSKACCLLFGLAYLYCSEQVEDTLIQCLFYIIVYMCGHIYWLFCSHC